MKIRTTQTQTQTTEIEINFPYFTKVIDNYSTKFYCLKSEKDIVKVEQYSNGKIINVSQWASASDAFQDNFEVITKDEFMSYYLETIDKLYVDLSVMKATLPKEIEDVEEEKEEEQGFEYDPETQTMN